MQNAQPTKLDNKRYNIYFASSMNYPYHIHRTYEIMRVVRGEAFSRIDGEERIITEGGSVAVFPYQYHSFRVEKGSKILICVFAPEFIPELDAMMRERIPCDPVISMPAEIFRLPETPDIFSAKAFFYGACSYLSAHLETRPRASGGKRTVLDRIFLFVDKNFRSDCSLKKLAETFNYDYTYLSKQFKAKMGISYNRYLNNFRINKACYQIINEPEKTVTEIASDCGFETVRTFNREFNAITGMTPLAYKSITGGIS